MNNRLKELRKALGLTMEEFGEALGMSKNGISEIENERNGVREPLIRLILSITWSGGRKVSEKWLRTGIGDMFEQLSPEDEMIRCLKEIQHRDPTAMQLRFIRSVAKLPPDKWGVIEELMTECVSLDDSELPSPKEL